MQIFFKLIFLFWIYSKKKNLEAKIFEGFVKNLFYLCLNVFLHSLKNIWK